MVLGLDARFKFDEMMWAVEALDSMKVSTGWESSLVRADISFW